MNFKYYTVHEIDELSRTGIYAIVNKVNGKYYLGSAARVGDCPSDSGFYVRWYNHVNTLKAGTHHSILLQRAWNKYGSGSFKFQILEFVDSEKCIEVEQTYLDLFPVGDRSIVYNTCFIADSILGTKYSEEAKSKISKALAKPFQLVSPGGEVINSINLRDFARKNNLDAKNLDAVTKGKVLHYKGYTANLKAHYLYLSAKEERGISWCNTHKKFIVVFNDGGCRQAGYYKLKEDAIKFRNDLEEEGITFRVLCMNWRKKLENATQK